MEKELKKVFKFESVKEDIINFLDGYTTEINKEGFVVGISGGIDSALVSTLCALTDKKVLCIEMPIHQNPDHVSRAKKHISWLKTQFPNVESIEIDLTDSFDVLSEALATVTENEKNAELALANTRSRLRMAALYAAANVRGLIVAGTGNRVEDFGVGFFTKGGDGVVDISPIADLTKTEVRKLAKYIGINEAIITAAPSDGLWADSRSDEDQIGATYAELEWAMEYSEKFGHITLNHNVFSTLLEVPDYLSADLTDRQKVVLDIFLKRHNANRHKMTPIPVCELYSKYEEN